QGEAGGGAAAARGAVHRVAAEHGHVAVVVVEDHAVHAAVGQVRGDLPAGADVGVQAARLDHPAGAEHRRGQGGVDGAAGGEVHGGAGRDVGAVDRYVAGDDVRRHVAERHRLDVPAPAGHPRGDPAGRYVDDHLRLAVRIGVDGPRLHRPGAERDRPVPAGGGESGPVPEQGAEVGALVVGRDQEAAVHVGVAARLVAQQPADAVGGGIGTAGAFPAFADGG